MTLLNTSRRARGGVKVHFHPFLTPALDGGGWLTPLFGRFIPGRNRYPLYKRLNGPQSRSGRVRRTEHILFPNAVLTTKHPARIESCRY
jgi:hypothetical protein